MMNRREEGRSAEPVGSSADPHCRTRPSDPAWPDAAAWEALNIAVGGNLIRVHSLFDPDRPTQEDELAPEAGVFNPCWIGDQPGGTQTSGWYGAWAPAPSAYAIRARNAADVAAGVKFARVHNLRLVVKGGAHSYLGHSNAPDSLMIWMRGMREATLHDAFVPQGGEGKVTARPAVSAQGGALWGDLYHAVAVREGRYVQGGGCMTVGVAGLIQGGGFGIFSKNFGLAASWLLEAEVVTADGEVRMANAFSEPELFWALKGGGGSTFGVITRLTLQTHDLPDHFGNARGKLIAKSDDAFKRLISRFFTYYKADILNPNWGDHFHFGPENAFELAMVSQGLSEEEAHDIWAPFFDWIANAPDDYAIVQPFETDIMPAQKWWDFATSPQLKRDPRPNALPHHGWSICDQGEVARFYYNYDSMWLPGKLLDADQRETFDKALFAATRHQMVRFQTSKGFAGSPEWAREAARDSAINPLAIDAFTLVVVAGGEGAAYPGMDYKPDLDKAKTAASAMDRCIAELRSIAPNSGSYVWETSFFLDNWQEEFWGTNYPRLRAIKQKYDPGGLFFIHHGVGSEEWSPDGFERAPR